MMFKAEAQEPSYLGDSVYVQADSGQIKLYTDNGEGEDQVIYLETETYEALLAWVWNSRITARRPE